MHTFSSERPVRWLQAAGRGCRILFCIVYAVIAVLFVVALYRDVAAADPATAVTAAPAAMPAGPFVRPSEAGRGGLMFRTPKAGLFEPAAEVGTQVRMRIAGLIGQVDVTQHFRNPGKSWREALYVFPLPEDAAVERIELRIGDRTIIGKIGERRKARQAYRQARAAGKRAALVEQSKPNLFTAAVANIGPGENVSVTLRYYQTPRFDDGAYSLRFPTTSTPRYRPKRGAAMVSATADPADKPMADPLYRDPATGKGNPMTFEALIEPGMPVSVITSPSHAIDVTGDDDQGYRLTLEGDAVPTDRDLELVWRPQAGSTPLTAAFIERRQDGDYVLLFLTPPTTDDAGDAKPDRRPREVIFVIDTSGSMEGSSIRQAKKALSLALQRLEPGARFNLVRFDSTAQALFPEPITATPETIGVARRAVAKLKADGGTNMQAALDLALDGKRDAGRLRQVVFITDGAVDNESELFRIIAGHLGDSRLFTVGIGTAPNGYFMREAAKVGRGSFTTIADTGQVAERMATLFAKLENPALTDIAVSLGDGRAEIMPRPTPDLFHGEPLVVAARLAKAREGGMGASLGRVRITGRLGTKDWQATLDLDRSPSGTGISRVWARRKITALLDARRTGLTAEEVRQAVLDTALAHGLTSPYTSLLAVDTSPVRPRDAELVKQQAPNNLPAGWQHGLKGASPSGPLPTGGGGIVPGGFMPPSPNVAPSAMPGGGISRSAVQAYMPARPPMPSPAMRRGSASYAAGGMAADVGGPGIPHAGAATFGMGSAGMALPQTAADWVWQAALGGLLLMLAGLTLVVSRRRIQG